MEVNIKIISKIFITLFAMLCIAGMCSTIARADIAIPNYHSRGTYTQGACITNNEKYIYVFKQNKGNYTNLQRINLKTGKPKRIKLSSSGRNAAYHSNDATFIQYKGKKYLLVAPSSSRHYIVIFKLSKSKAIYKGKIYTSFGVSGIAAKSIKGNLITCYAAKSKEMKKIKIDFKKKRVISQKKIAGYRCNQGISLCGQYVTGCKGGFYSNNGRIIKYKIKNNKLVKVYSKKIKYEPQEYIITNKAEYIVIEGNIKYAKGHKDVIIIKKFFLPNLLSLGIL